MLWLTMSHKQTSKCHTTFQTLYNQKMLHGRSVVAKSFGISKEAFVQGFFKSFSQSDCVPVCYCALGKLILYKNHVNSSIKVR
jgi:hypothetical protein